MGTITVTRIDAVTRFVGEQGDHDTTYEEPITFSYERAEYGDVLAVILTDHGAHGWEGNGDARPLWVWYSDTDPEITEDGAIISSTYHLNGLTHDEAARLYAMATKRS